MPDKNYIAATQQPPPRRKLVLILDVARRIARSAHGEKDDYTRVKTSPKRRRGIGHRLPDHTTSPLCDCSPCPVQHASAIIIIVVVVVAVVVVVVAKSKIASSSSSSSIFSACNDSIFSFNNEAAAC